MTSKRRRRRQKGKRKEAERRLEIERARTWEILNDTPAKQMARARKEALREVRRMADMIVGVQPMTGPVGEIFTVKHRYAGGRDEDTTVEAQDSTQAP